MYIFTKSACKALFLRLAFMNVRHKTCQLDKNCFHSLFGVFKMPVDKTTIVTAAVTIGLLYAWKKFAPTSYPL